ncbi:MAG: GNAT family protein [Paludibacter sp.]|nr:GNAT family protein [Paludibacter sp.]
MNGKRILKVDDKILLTEIGLEDVEVIFQAIDRDRKYLEEWLPFVDQTREINYTHNYVESYLSSDRIDVTFAIYYKNGFAGIIGLKDTDLYNKKTEIGYWLSESCQHKGIITLSANALIEYIFDEMHLNRIQLKAATGNLKSQAVARRLGFKQEGIERESELHSRGFVDLVVFGLLKADR